MKTRLATFTYMIYLVHESPNQVKNLFFLLPLYDFKFDTRFEQFKLEFLLWLEFLVWVPGLQI